MKKLVLILCILLPLTSCGQTKKVKPEAAVSASSTPFDLSAYPKANDKVVKSDKEWKELLSEKRYDILREKGTETAGTGALLNEHRRGIFKCAACSNPLFSSKAKFESGTGWPSFYQPIEMNRVEEISDESHGMDRTEVLCARCGGHLGHVFNDGPMPTGLRYCMNSAAMVFDPK